LKPASLRTWLTFFRGINLLIVAITMYLLRWVVLYPFLSKTNIPFSLTGSEFFLMVLATMLVTLNGYVINDYYDVEIDRVNKPEKLFIEKYLSKTGAYKFWWAINLLGGALAFTVAVTADQLPWFALYPLAIMLLWWYAFKLKRKPLFGNLLVSFFCGGVALLVLFSERYALYKLMDVNKTAYQLASNLFWFYAVFAFLSNLYRELLKDLEDQEGDRLAGCLTVPLAWGVRPALWIAFSAGSALLAVLIYFLATRSFVPIYTVIWAIITLVIPVFRNMLVLKPNSAATDFHHASQRAKYMMLSGLVLLPLLVWES